MTGYKNKTDRIIITKSTRNQNKHHRIIREQYLRDDIPCQSDICTCCQTQERCRKMSKDATHYLIPDVDVTSYYLEILEFPEISGIIFVQSVVTEVLHNVGKRMYNRICRKINGTTSNSIFFPNEFSQYTYLQREPGESLDDWLAKNIFECASWYHRHLCGKVHVVVLTEKPEVVERYGNLILGIHVMSVGEYLNLFWPNLTSALNVCESLRASLTTVTITENTDYKEYLPREVLLTGVQSGKYSQGILKVNKYNASQEAFVSPMGTLKKIEDIFIFGMKMRNRAIDGDLVVIELLPRDQWKSHNIRLRDGSDDQSNSLSTPESEKVRKTGQVVGVFQHAWRDYVASFPQNDNSTSQPRTSSEAVLVIPYDYRIPKIRILTQQAENLKNDRIVVKIDSWNTKSQYPNGHFVRSLGKCGELETEIATLLVENEVTVHDFSTKVLSEMPNESWKVDEEEAAKRKDFRNTHVVFSIDPIGCEDVDDCLSYRDLGNGRSELGVHIADVTWFVPPNSATDLEARTRSTTVYMADRRFDMLPSVLSGNVCSLLSNQDRYAVSVIWTLNSNFEVEDVWYGRSVIRSSYKLSYELADKLLNGAVVDEIVDEISEFQNCEKKTLSERFDKLVWFLRKLTDIGNALKFERLQNGALELESTEVQIEFEEISKDLQNIKPKQALEIHEVVAECMIFANHWVAKKIYDAFPEQSLLRYHPPPRDQNFKDLQLCAEANGFTFDFGSNKLLAMSLNKAVNKKDPYVNMLMRMLTVQCMMMAKYFSTGTLLPDEYYHYGLALEKYTHFTSPIRRYADILVHRLLLAALNIETEVPNVMLNTELQELCDHINSKHRASKNCQKASQQLFQTLYFQDKDPSDERCVVDAVIFSLRTNGFLVYIPRYALKGPVYLVNKENQVAFVVNGTMEWTSGKITQHSFKISVESTLGCQEYKLFDHITVQTELVTSQVHACGLKFNLVDNKPKKHDASLSPGIMPRQIKPVNFVKEIQKTQGATPDEKCSSPSKLPESPSLYLVIEQLKELSLQVNPTYPSKIADANPEKRLPLELRCQPRHKMFRSGTYTESTQHDPYDTSNILK